MQCILVCGLGFGDEGKGSIVDAIVRKTGADLVVRYNGGAQAAHHVVTTDGRSHCFSQFGAGTFAGARTYLSRYMLWDPLALAVEGQVLRTTLGTVLPRVMVDARAPVLTPWHRALNRLREASRGPAANGTCGLGIGELASDLEANRTVIRTEDLLQSDTHLVRRAARVQTDKLLQLLALPPIEIERDDVQAARDLMLVTPEQWAARVRAEALEWIIVPSRMPEADVVVFEGAQGVLLDQTHGFPPHTTWTDCTYANADAVLDEVGFKGPRLRVGVTRAFTTRHGAGPFPTEHAGAMVTAFAGEHNVEGPWQGPFRGGPLDMVLLRYAVEVAKPDELVVTCLDSAPPIAATSYRLWRPVDAPLFDGVVVMSDGSMSVNAIKVPVVADRAHLTTALGRVQPDFRDAGRSLEDLVAQYTCRPVTITSYGPTALDKCFDPVWIMRRGVTDGEPAIDCRTA